METGRLANKQVTANHGTGLTTSATTNQRIVTVPEIQVTTADDSGYTGQDDNSKILTGAGGGDYAVGGGSTNPHRWGHTTPSGSRIEINDTPGGERVEFVHKSGSGVVIDPDGGVYIVSTAARGGGIGAPQGDFYITAGGDLVIQSGASGSIKTPGDLTLEVGGTLTFKATAIKTITNSLDEQIDGSATRDVTNDQAVMIGGINRLTVAGDNKTQVSSKNYLDVGSDNATKVNGNNTQDVKGNHTARTTGDSTLDTNGTSKVRSNGNMVVSSAAELDARGNTTKVSSAAEMTVAAGGDAIVSSKSNMTVVGDSTAKLHSQGSTDIVGQGGVAVKSGSGATLSGSTVNIKGGTTNIGSGTVNINTSTLNAPVPTGSSGSAGSPDAASADGGGDPVNPDSADSSEDAKVPEAKQIVDYMTSARKYPEYLGNGVREAASGTSSVMGGGDGDGPEAQAEEVYNEYSGKNTGSLDPSEIDGDVETLGEQAVNRPDGITVADPGISIPSRYQTSAKISKYFTLGMLTGAKHSYKIPNSIWKTIVKNHILAAYNILDPIKEKFPDMLVTSAYRPGSKNHRTGRAIDLVVESRSLARHAEIARFVRDNCPADQVFLERNNTGKTHVHIRVGESGSSPTPKVLTCGDQYCRSVTSGIKVEYLTRKRKR